MASTINVLLFVQLLATGFTADLDFDCVLSGCNGEDCTLATGVCDCDAAIVNPDYACVPAALGGCGGCIDENTWGGTGNCAPGGNCQCNEHYKGATCETKRVDAVCENDRMTLTLDPVGVDGADFAGKVFIKSTNDFSDFTVPADCETTGAFEADVHYSSGATDPGCVFAADVTQVDGNYNIYAYVQYNPNLQGPKDIVIEFQCASTSNVATGAGVSVLEGNAVSGDDANMITSTHSKAANGMEIRLAQNANPNSYTDITDPLNLGDPISLIITHTEAFTVKSCVARNYGFEPTDVAPADADIRTITIVDEWCITLEALTLFRDPPLTFDTGTDVAAALDNGAPAGGLKLIRFDFNAWYFSGTPDTDVFIQCETCVGCNPIPVPECPTSITDFTGQNTAITTRRRRRSTEPHGTNTTLGVSVPTNAGKGGFTINIGNTGNDSNGDVSVSECYKSTSVLLPIILLAGLLLVAMVMTFFFCQKLTRDDRMRNGETNMAYKS